LRSSASSPRPPTPAPFARFGPPRATMALRTFASVGTSGRHSAHGACTLLGSSLSRSVSTPCRFSPCASSSSWDGSRSGFCSRRCPSGPSYTIRLPVAPLARCMARPGGVPGNPSAGAFASWRWHCTPCTVLCSVPSGLAAEGRPGPCGIGIGSECVAPGGASGGPSASGSGGAQPRVPRIGA